MFLYKSAKQGSRLFPPGSYLLADTFQLFLMKRNGPFCGEEKRFQRTMTRAEVALSLSDAWKWRAKSDLTCNSSKHACTLLHNRLLYTILNVCVYVSSHTFVVLWNAVWNYSNLTKSRPSNLFIWWMFILLSLMIV